jgi:hypothetical protein
MSEATVPIETPSGAPEGRPEPAVVDHVDELTPAWFDAVLGTGGTASAVRSVTTEPVGTGQMAATVRARLTLDDGRERTVVVKYARADLQSPMAGVAYAKEVAFYAELGDRVAVRTPECLYAAITEGAPRFVLVLEDLAGARQGDQIAGCPVEHAEAALVNLAGLHGPTWGDTAHAFAERFAAELDPSEAAVLEAARELLAEWMFDDGDRVAVLHGDYRLDNLLFPVDDPAGVAAVDWQTASVGPPGRDVAFFLSTCLEVEDRRRHEHDLVAAYHGALAAHGVSGYSLDECFADYRLGLLHGPLIILLGRLTAGVTERGDEMFRAMWRRSTVALDDLAGLDLVRANLARGR